MLTEQFVAAISGSTKPNTGVTKDQGIFIHEFQPLAAQRNVFKKSATAQNGIAMSSTHIFAAQTEKAIVHVYSREKGNQEAIVPFPERIHSIALTAQDTVLLLGGESGRVLAWEICSGRLVSTSTSHLQPVTSLVVDPSSNFFLSGSADAMIHVWALPSILSFSPDKSRSPVHTLSTHRGPISSIACGHSSSTVNIAVSTSGDKTAIVWDYHNGQALRTYLLPDTPTSVTLDPVDRACFIGYADGSLQTIDFYDDIQKATSTDVLRDTSSSHRPMQPSPKTRFGADSQKLGGILSLSLSWDGTTLVSGHSSGKIASWDIAKSNYLSTLANLSGPVSNLQFLRPTGFSNTKQPTFKVQTIVKPKQDAGLTGSSSGLVPSNYNLSMHFTGRVDIPSVSATEQRSVKMSSFSEALTHPSFPASMLEEGLAELDSWIAPSKGSSPAAATVTAPVQSEYVKPSDASNDVSSDEVKELKKQVASLQRIQKVTFAQLSELREEKEYFMEKERKRTERGQAKKKGSESNDDNDVEMSDGDENES
ncbi:WD40 repeat-like protein [Didymella exigua CBS 183.55]|uniref:Pre-rRNA-processing protein IPI3 n=1 Tax=Didymella exigua CBS 183.55 TaxID=1150837 RepID=A0A6A5S011_9PLEO|nr:WD40 repeat-like protein [Didymella exigua CBS 183.55]KAF1934011.1 WD40 repeat-like protein [Didymella exigua CBS 183.55]